MVSPGVTVLFNLMMQQRTQKTRFLNVGHTRKSQIAVITQASWHSNTNFQSQSVSQRFILSKSYSIEKMQYNNIHTY